MLDLVFEKSDKGIEEIKSRVYKLESRLRTLLVLVDGKQNVSELMTKVRGLGISEESFSYLLDNDFIQLSANQRTRGLRTNSGIAPNTQIGLASNTKRQIFSQTLAPVTRIVTDVPPLNQPTTSQMGTRSVHDVESYQTLYKFYNETIKNNLGLRGYFLEVKVEKAGTLQDLIDLRLAFYEALKKAKGETTARALLTRLDELILA